MNFQISYSNIKQGIVDFLSYSYKNPAKLFMVLSSIAASITFLYVAFLRINYDFDLEWNEGLVLDNVWRIHDGLPVYTKPSPGFISNIYPPVYYYFVYFLWKIFSPGYFSARLISIFSTLIIALFLFLITQKITSNKIYSLSTSGFFLASYYICGWWFDLARVDMLAHALLIASFYLLLSRNIYMAALAGFLSALSLFTKQSLFPLCMLLPLSSVFFKDYKKVLFFFLSFILLSLLIFVILHYNSEGWSTYYLFVLPSMHELRMDHVRIFFMEDLGYRLIPALLLIIMLIFSGMRKMLSLNKTSLYIAIIALFSLLISFYSRLHYGGYNNSLITLFVFLPLCLTVLLSGLKDDERVLGKLGCEILLFAQIILLLKSPSMAIPKERDLVNLKNFKSRFVESSSKGKIFMPCHGFWSRYYGGEVTIHQMSFITSIILKPGSKSSVTDEFEKAIESGNYRILIFDYLPAGRVAYLIKEKYKTTGTVKDPPRMFTGMPCKPVYVWELKD